MARRIPLNQYATANPLVYAGARTWVFTVDENNVTTTTLTTLYDGPTGTGTLANPQDLDSQGKWAVIPYIETKSIIRTKSLPFGEHDTGIIQVGGGFRGEWGPGIVYATGDLVRVGNAGAGGSISLGDIYWCDVDHTSGTNFETDVQAAKWTLFAAVGAAVSASELAEAWATDTDGTVDGLEYSAKEYAQGTQAVAGGSAKQWASRAEDSTVPGGGGLFSSLHYAAKALASKTAAETAETNAETAETNAETAETNAEAAAAAAAAAQAAAEVAQAAAEAIVDAFDPPLPVSIANGGTGSTTASDARDALGLEIGVDIQGYSSILGGMAAATAPIANQGLYFTAPGVAAPYFLTSTGRTIVAASSMSNARDLIGVEIGADVQAFDADLDAIAALGSTGFAVRTGAGTWAQREITGAGTCTVTGGNGVSGNVTITGGSSAQTIEDISGNDTLVAADIGRCFRITANATIALEAVATLGAGWWCDVIIDGDYNDMRVVEINPSSSEEIDEQTTIKAYLAEKFRIYCDGSKLRTYGRSAEVFFGEFVMPTGASDSEFFTDGAFMDDPEIVETRVHASLMSHSSVTGAWTVTLVNGSGSEQTSNYTDGLFNDYSAPAGADSTSNSSFGALSGSLNATDAFDLIMTFVCFRGLSDYTLAHIVAHAATAVPVVAWGRHAAAMGGFRINTSGGNVDAGTVRVWGKRLRRS